VAQACRGRGQARLGGCRTSVLCFLLPSAVQKMAATAPVELIDDHVSPVQCARAVKALLKHAHAAENKRAESELLPGAEQHVWLVLAVKQMHPEKKLKPFRMCV
jgi:hypothetical protein